MSCNAMTRGRAGKERAEEEEERRGGGIIYKKRSFVQLSFVAHVSVCIAGPLIS